MPCAAKNTFLPFVLILALTAAGICSATAAPHYFTRTWQVEQGLPQNKVAAIVQTRDGYLWVGTYNGLARFDGISFRVFDDNSTPELRNSRITSLFEADDGTLWIGTEGGDITSYRDGHFAAAKLPVNWSNGKIYGITGDDAGDVWVVNEPGELLRVRDGKILSPPSGGVNKVVSFTRGRDGTVWAGRDGLVSVLKGGRFTGELFASDYVQGFCAAKDGGFWVASNGSIRKWKSGNWVANYGVAPWGMNIIANLMETSDGVLVAGSADVGLWFVFPGEANAPALHFDHTSGLPSDWVLSLWEDREKNLWCGTGAGLVVVRSSHFETVSPPDKWKNRSVLSVLPTPDGALWVGTEGAGLYRFKDDKWTNFGGGQGIRNYYVWALAADDMGKVWAGTWGGGLLAQRNDWFEDAPGLESYRSPTPALLFSGNELWIGTTTGALRYQNGRCERFNGEGGEPLGDVRAILRDKSGALWFGTAGAGLVRWQDGQLRRFGTSDGLSNKSIECLHSGEDDALWIGTLGGGLNRFKGGKFAVINRERGLPNSVIAHIEADNYGYFWMSSYGGILRASERDLNRCADGEITQAAFLTYGISDGLPTIECSDGLQSAGGKTADGRLWFATAKGLVAVDPAGVRTNSLVPPVWIEQVRVDDRNLAEGNDADPVKIPPGLHRIEFEYTGLSFVAPEKVRFKCRLSGFETDWVDVGGKRAVTYNYIPPGRYSFQAIACNNDGFWNETGAGMAVEVLPYFWQTTWFHVFGATILVLTASGAVWFETRRRLRRKLERTERQRDIERERSRIARDIHDDLGAHLTRITMMSESARGELSNPERAAAGLKTIYNTALELTRSMDEIVWAVNPRHDTLESLVTYLEKFAHDWLATAGFRCRLDLPLDFPEWSLSSEVRHNVFLAFKEALHNAVKHSGASEISIRLAMETAGFELIIGDNGRGFASDSRSENAPGRVVTGNGLSNMKRRLEGIGGSCEIESAPGMGTKVRFHVPINASAIRKPGR